MDAYYHNCKSRCSGHLYCEQQVLLCEALLGSKKSRVLWWDQLCLLLCPHLKGSSANPPSLLYSVTSLMLSLLPRVFKFSLGMMEKGSLNSVLLLQTSASSSTWALGFMYLPKKWEAHGRAGGCTGPAFSCIAFGVKSQCQVCPWKHLQDRGSAPVGSGRTKPWGDYLFNVVAGPFQTVCLVYASFAKGELPHGYCISSDGDKVHMNGQWVWKYPIFPLGMDQTMQQLCIWR